MIIDNYSVPEDWALPNFDDTNRVHNWKNYVIKPVRDVWYAFTPDLKQRLAANFQDMADREEWN